MTIYCTGEEGTYLSINGGDFVTYPPGSDIEVVSVNVAAYLFSEHYRASWASGGCTNWQSKLYGCTNSGYLTLRAVSAPAQASLTQMLADIGGNNGIPDGCPQDGCFPDGCTPLAEQNVKANSISAGNIEYWVFQFVPMHAQLDLIVRQCVECGIAKIVPVLGQRSPRLGKQAIDSKLQRFERLVKEARQQSGSPVDTKIFAPMKLDDALDMWKKSDEKKPAQDKNFLKTTDFSAEKNTSVNSVAFVLHEANIADKTLFEYASSALELSNGQIKKVALAVGPEGGMTNEEVSSFKEAGFKLIHFETNVLRCETACLYGIAAIQSAFTEYKSWQKSE